MASSKEKAKQGVPCRTLGRTGEKASAIGVGAPAGLRRQVESPMD
jgi:hypothetical protein